MATQITTELDFAVNNLKERGFKVKYTPTTWDDNSFYRIVSFIKWNSFGHPKSARNELKKVQTEKDHLLFFLAFEPENSTSDNNEINIENKLKSELSKSKKANGIPSRRDIFAAAECLQKPIHMLYWQRNGIVKEVIDPPFTSYVTDEAIYILSVSHGDSDRQKTAFLLLIPTEDQIEIHTAKHSQCHGLAFRRSFSHQHCDSEENIELIEGKLNEDSSVTRLQNNYLFCSLRKAMYGSQDYHCYVRQLIVKCLRDDAVAQVFFDSTDECADTERHISNLHYANAPAGKAELYAAAYIYRTRIFVQLEASDSWLVYFPLSVPGNINRSSYIPVTKAHRLLATDRNRCTCVLNEPPVDFIESFSRDKLMSLATNFIMFRRPVCCKAETRHGGHHTHLDAFCKDKQRKREYKRNGPAAQSVVFRVDGRTLDVVTGDSATFRQCIHKLIYGTDEVPDDFEVREEAPDETYLKEVADWLQKSIYIYSSMSSTWEVYTPSLTQSVACSTSQKKTCRFYVTLFYEHSTDRYDIITPEKGCNCTMPPPTFDTGVRELDEGKHIPKHERHNALAEFLLDDNIRDSFSDETQNMLSKEGYPQIHEVFRRPDMQYREVDQGYLHTLYTCLSKEIFGNEEEASRIEQLVVKEMLDHADIYVRVLDVKSRMNLKTQNLQKEVNRILVPFLLLFRHVPLLAAATVFQTPIYVLKVEPADPKTNEETG